MRKIILASSAVFITVFLCCVFFSDRIFVLNPKGIVGIVEKDVLILVFVLMLTVIIPVFGMALVFSTRYREGKAESRYDPNYNNSFWLELQWWGFPTLIVIVLSGISIYYSILVDPFNPLENYTEHKGDPKTVQVVALQWKWLFIYPEEKIATMNYLQIPEKVPIRFEITADAPMNSFWIPQLGGQIYAMPGMRTLLHLISDQVGTYYGSSANLSGAGFAGMRFETVASTDADYKKWVETVKSKAKEKLNYETYQRLAEPSEYVPPTYFQLDDEDLFKQIVHQYMGHGQGEKG